MLIREVKVSQINNLSHARYCAGMGVQWLSFETHPDSSFYIDPALMKEIAGWVSGPEMVLNVNLYKTEEDIRQVAAVYGTDLIEIDLDHPAYVNLDDLDKITLINSDQFNKLEDLPAGLPGHKFFSIEVRHDISEQQKEKIRLWAGKNSFLLGIIFAPEDIEGWINTEIRGFTLYSNEEERPGYTSYDHLGDILEKLEEEG